MSTLNIAFLISSAELKNGDRNYRDTISSYKIGPGAMPPVAYIKLPEHQKDLLPDVIDWLYNNDIRPIVATEGFNALILPQQERTKDILALFSHPEVNRHAYTLFVGGGWKVSTINAFECLDSARSLLATTPSILSVAFESAQATTSTNHFLTCPSLTSRPVIVRTRDMMLAAKLAVDNAAQLQALSSEQAISNMMGMFSYSPYKHLCFNPSVAHSL